MTRDEIKARHAAWSAEYASGDSMRIIAKRHNVTHIAVCFALRRLGVTARKGNVAPVTLRAIEERNSRIVNACANGVATADVARDLGVSAGYARQIARKGGVSAPRRTTRYDRMDEMIRDYNAGASLKSVAARYGVDFCDLSRRLRREGVTMRPRGRPRTFDRAAVLAAYTAGRPRADIAREFGIGVSTVSHLAAEAGVQRNARRL